MPDGWINITSKKLLVMVCLLEVDVRMSNLLSVWWSLYYLLIFYLNFDKLFLEFKKLKLILLAVWLLSVYRYLKLSIDNRVLAQMFKLIFLCKTFFVGRLYASGTFFWRILNESFFRASTIFHS